MSVCFSTFVVGAVTIEVGTVRSIWLLPIDCPSTYCVFAPVCTSMARSSSREELMTCFIYMRGVKRGAETISLLSVPTRIRTCVVPTRLRTMISPNSASLNEVMMSYWTEIFRFPTATCAVLVRGATVRGVARAGALGRLSLPR